MELKMNKKKENKKIFYPNKFDPSHYFYLEVVIVFDVEIVTVYPTSSCLLLPMRKPLAGWGWVAQDSADSAASEGWGLRWVGGWLVKHTLQRTLTSWPGLSCKAHTGISSNSLGCADRGEGRKMLRLPLPFSCASPNVGENNECAEHRERFIAEGERTAANNASLCNSLQPVQRLVVHERNPWHKARSPTSFERVAWNNPRPPSPHSTSITQTSIT